MSSNKLTYKELGKKLQQYEEQIRELKQSEKKYRNLFDKSSDPTLIIENGKFIECNDAAYDFFGFKNKKEIIGKTPQQISPKYQSNKKLSSKMASYFIQKALNEGSVKFEWIHEKADGSEVWVSISLTSVEFQDRDQIYAVFRDIDELKRAQVEFKSSEEKFRKFMNNLPGGVFIKDDQGRYEFLNKFNEKKFNISDWKGKTAYDYFDKKIAEKYDEEDKKALERGSLQSRINVKDEEGNDLNFITHYFTFSEATGKRMIGGISLDITKEITVRKELERSEEKYRTVFENSALGIFRSKPDGSYEVVNDTFAEILGYKSAKEMISKVKNISEIYKNKSDRERVIDLFKREGFIKNFEIKVNAQHKRDVWIAINAVASLNADEEIYYEGTIQDITKRKLSELALKENEQKFRTLFEELTEGVILEDSSFNILDANKAALKYLGLTYEQITSRTALDPRWQVINEDGSKIPNDKIPIARALDSGKLVENQIVGVYHPKLKTHRWLSVNAVPLFFDKKGNPEIAYSIFTDITEERKTKLELKQSEEKYRRIVETANDLFWTVDNDGIITEMSKSSKEIYGYEPEELIGKNFLDFTPKEQKFKDKKALKVIQDISDYDSAFIHKDGHIVYLKANSVPVKDEKGNNVGITGASKDVTEEVTAKKELKENEERLRAFIDSNVVGTIQGDVYGGIIKANDKYLEIIGYTREELESGEVKWDKITPPEFSALDTKKIEEAKKYGMCTPYEKQYVRKDGTRIWVIVGFVLVGEKREESIAFILDIQNMKDYQKQLEERNFFIQKVLDNLPIGVALNYIDKGDAFYANKKFEEIYGWSIDELKTVDYFFKKVYPDKNIRKQMQDRIINDMKSGDISKMHWENCPITKKDGSKRFVNAHNIPLFDQNTMVSTVIDVTETKEYAEALKESEENYRLLVENQTDLVVKVDPNGKFEFVSQSYCKMFGKKEEELIGKKFLPLVHPDDRGSTQEALEKLVEPPHECYLEQRAKTVEGWRWLAWSDKGITDEDGEIQSILGVGRDITQQKEAEYKLRESEEAYRTLINSSADAIYVLKGRRLLLVNDAWLKMFGYKREEVLDNKFSVMKIVAPESESFIKPKFDKPTMELNEVVNYEMKGLTKSGEKIDLQVSVSRIRWKNDIVYQGIYHDITEMKERQKRIIEERNKAERYFETAAVMMLVLGTDGKVVRINQKGAEILGYTKKYIIGKKWIDNFIPKKYHAKAKNMFKDAINGNLGDNVYAENDVICRYNHRKILAWHNNILRDEDNNVIGVLSSAEDITDETRLKEELKSKNTELSFLTNRIQELREEERKSLAREIHDDLGQALTAIKLDLTSIKNIKQNPEQINDKVRSAISLTDETIKTVQDITSELRPGLIDDLGLLPTIEWYTEQFSGRTDIKIKVNLLISEKDINEKTKIILYRIIQESLTNIARHSKADRVNLRLERKNKKIILSIRDNGKGLSKSDLDKSTSFGLLSMRERALSLKGNLKIEGKKDKGTLVKLIIPLE